MRDFQGNSGAVFLDDLQLPGAEIEAGVEGDRCMHALGLSGPFRFSQQPANAPLTLLFEGLQARAWPHATASADGSIPEPLRAQIWPDAKTEVFFIGDAAKFADRGGELAWAGLEVRCLFSGEAAERLANVAPYLIRLPSDHTFARRLFRNDGQHWCYWPLGAGVFLHSTAPMNEIHKQLRRFTKLNDGSSWKFMRLAEPRTLLPMLIGLSSGLRGRMFENISRMIAIDPDEEILITADCADLPKPVAARIEPRLKATLDASVRARFARDALRFCQDTIVDRPAPEGLDEKRFGSMALRKAWSIGLYDRQAVLLACAAAWYANSADAGWLQDQGDLTDRRDVSQLERARALLKRAYAI